MPTPAQKTSGNSTGAIRSVGDDQIKVWDFRAAGALDASRLAPLSAANEVFARNLAATFASRFQVPCEISISSIDMAACEAFVEGAAANAPYFHSIILGSHAEMGVLQIETAVLFVLLDCFLGGSGTFMQEPREITEIEGQMARELVKIMAQELQNAWRAYNIEVRVGSQHSPDQLLQTLPTSVTALVPTFAIRIAELEGKFQLMLPIPSIAAFLKPAPRPVVPSDVPASTMSPRLGNQLLQMCYSLELVTTNAKLPANEILNLSVGQVISLGAPASAPVALSVGGRTAFTALPVRHGDSRAAQLIEQIHDEAAFKNSGKCR